MKAPSPQRLRDLEEQKRRPQRENELLREHVVVRKVWGGNRTPLGTRMQRILMSFLRTCHQPAREPLQLLAQLLRSSRPRIVDFSGTPRLFR